MNMLSTVTLMCCVIFLTACDVKNDYQKPKTDARTMIIGGMPIHDHDYQLKQLNARDVQPVHRQ